MKAKTLLLLAIVAITCTGMMCECDDENYEPQLPPETTTGANTFGCLVNGEVWRNGGVGFPNYSLAVQQLNDTSAIIEAISIKNKIHSSFLIYLSNEENLVSKKYTINNSNIYTNYWSFTEDSNNDDCSYEQSGKGFIEITRFDLINGIVSGRFEATLYSDSCDSIVITKGRFDLKK